ncbi:hypothetical protein CKO28_10790 [Rhodovibrio sodomensis]|uniref:Lysylphosphatidylglycerol synthetase family protein n=1 Tax=Rhodovibrio sodomensis TaxID=1088 RepID=A0ABS1DEA2_9PROT|nr:lysylphosphatidylglycerol synthase transmembrane domain-containing protein [Rhodovibrio sodomensis]MBK1668519.1 hypothetical protein [Rhodovibrio sodomensis]
MASSSTSRRRCVGWRPVLRIAGSLALVAGLAATIELGETARLLAGADPLAVTGLLFAAQLQVLLSAARWRLVARRLGLPLGWAAACAEYYLCLLLNQLLPGGVSGDAVRALRHARRLPALPGGGGAGRALRAVVLERFAGQVAFFAIAGLGLALWPLLIPGGYASWVASAAAALGVAILILLVALALGTRIGPRRWRLGVAALVPEGRAALLGAGAWRMQLPLNLAVAVCLIAAFALAADAVGPALPVQAWITVIPLTLLALVLPISVGGWGLRESAAALLWPTVGLAPEAGVAAGLMYGVAMLVSGLPGAAAVLRRRRPAVAPA